MALKRFLMLLDEKCILGIKVSIMEPGCFQTGMTQPAAIERQLRQCWNNLSDELKKEYGEEYLEKSTYTSNTRTKYF